tara:strand:+ start:1653 stop:2696 length:1044 start_codon:yes stop_codon:yes gene_type:complete
MTNRHIVDRALPERANLMFYFPVPTQGSDYYVIELPFFENVSIKESKKARYQKYSMISRSSNLYSYLGADSRNLNLSFNLTLPHILDEHPNINLDEYVNYDRSVENVEGEKERFREPFKAGATPTGMAFELGTKYTQDLARTSAQQVLRDNNISNALNAEDQHFMQGRYGLHDENSINPWKDRDTAEVFKSSNQEDYGNLWVPPPGYRQSNAADQNLGNLTHVQNNQVKYRIIDLIIYWTNIIRSSVVNNAKNPIYGPPVIRLRHGILYQDIPCICTNYSIDYNEAAGYDMDTLLPRQLKINMKLEEIRTGDFGEFDTTNIIRKDNLAGWEAVVEDEYHSMDPGYRS